MARKKSTKDYAIPMDEFHPNPSIAAAFADLKASESTERHLLADLRRNEERAPRDSTEKKIIRAEWLRLKEALRQTLAEREGIVKIIEEAKVK
jgi:hypothetical protein